MVRMAVKISAQCKKQSVRVAATITNNFIPYYINTILSQLPLLLGRLENAKDMKSC